MGSPASLGFFQQRRAAQLRAAICAAVAKEDYEAAASMKNQLWALEQGADLAEQDGRYSGDIAEI